MRTLAFISDIHGNSAALRAALADMAGRGITEIYALGDLVGYGPDPNDVVDLVRGGGIPMILGNYDDGVAFDRGDCGCYYADDEARRIGDASYAFTATVLSEEAKAWLRAQPYQRHLRVDGRSLMLVHGSPRRINEYLQVDRDSRTYERLAAELRGGAAESGGADILVFGHTHLPWHREHGGVLFVNVGSTGRPKDGDPRAMYTMLHLEEGIGGTRRGSAPDSSLAPAADQPAAGAGLEGVHVEVVRVAYDMEETASGVLAAGLPADLAEAFRRGR